MLRILIADDHGIVRKAVRRLIERRPGWQVCAEAADEALDLAIQEKPDIAILAVSLPLLNGVGVTRRLLQQQPATRVLLFTMHDDDETVHGGLAAGARGYVLKTDSEQHLEAAIAVVGSNRSYFSPGVSELLLNAAMNGKRSRPDSFSPRELEVAQSSPRAIRTSRLRACSASASRRSRATVPAPCASPARTPPRSSCASRSRTTSSRARVGGRSSRQRPLALGRQAAGARGRPPGAGAVLDEIVAAHLARTW
jgi:DNA-binding NarL/FixJ family response regulator